MKTADNSDSETTINPDDPLIIGQLAYVNQFLHDSNQDLLEINNDLNTEVKMLREKINLLLQKRFGASSEKLNDHQLKLFNEAEATVEAEKQTEEETETATTTVVETHERKKRGRKPLPKHLPRQRVEHDIPDAEKICQCCGSHDLHKIGENISEQLDIVPAKIQVLQHVRPKYGCRTCEGAPKVAPLPAQPIPKSIAAPGLLAYIAVSKYMDGLPLYRQTQFIIKRLGVEISRASVAQWMIACGLLIQPLINLLQDKLLESQLIHMDETTTQVLKEPERAAESTSYMWVQVSGSQAQKIILFNYSPTRAAETPAKLLTDFSGYLQTDGYAAYDSVASESALTIQGCWAHARRKFDEVIKAAGKKVRSGKSHQAMSFITKLYVIERNIKDSDTDTKYKVRQQRSIPILQGMRAWLDKSLPQAPPGTLLGKALNYLHNQWDKLVRYCNHGWLRMDNNLAENAIRPFVIGRKNWLFSNSQAGAVASANLYSLIETTKANGLEPFAYLKAVFTQLPQAETVDDIEKLLPWNFSQTP